MKTTPGWMTGTFRDKMGTGMDPLLFYFLGGIACVMNLWYTVTRTFWYGVIRRQPARVLEYSCPLPVLGSLLVGLSLCWTPYRPALLWGGVGLILIDTGGLHWFVILRAWQRRRAMESS